MSDKKVGKDNKDLAISYFAIGEKFFNLSHLSSMEMVKSGNNLFVISDKPISHNEYYEKTKWSDLEVSIPILFNFYHGIELTLKGCIVLQDRKVDQTHKFSSLIDCLSVDSKNERLLNKIKSYTTELDKNSVVGRFLIDNKLDIDNWYEALKYPFISNKQKVACTSFISLKCGGKSTAPFWSDIASASKEIVALAVQLSEES